MSAHRSNAEALVAYALRYPEAWRDSPWGESVVKVRKKIFVFVGAGDRLTLSVKLPETGQDALLLAFTSPTRYGLGKSGWVSAGFDSPEQVPLDLIEEWIDESYRAVAPKKLARGLPPEGPPGTEE